MDWSVSGDHEVVSLVEEALAALGEDGDPLLRAKVLAAYAGYQATLGIHSEDAAREALAMARLAGDPATVAVALNATCWSLAGGDRPADMEAVAEELIAVGRSSGDLLQQAQGHFWRSTARLALGDRVGFDADIEILGALGERTRSGQSRVRAAMAVTCQALLDGRFDQVGPLADAMLELTGDDVSFWQAYGGQLFLCAVEQGRFRDLEELLSSLAADENVIPAFSAALAMVLAELGELEEARAIYEQLAADGFDALQHDLARVVALGPLTELTVRFGDQRRASELTELYRGYAGTAATTASAICMGAADRYLGMLATVRGDHGVAQEHFRAALRLEDSLASPPLLARTKYWCARHLVAAGEHDQAVRFVAEAATAATDLGMIRLAEQALSLQHDLEEMRGSPIP